MEYARQGYRPHHYAVQNEERADEASKKHSHTSLRGSNHHHNLRQNHRRRHRHQVEHVDSNSIEKEIAEKDRKIRLVQAATLMKLQKQEVNDDLMKLREVTQDGLQSMFAKAVAKQQKFMDDVQGPGDRDELVARDQLQNDPEKTFLLGDRDDRKPANSDQVELTGSYNNEQRNNYEEQYVSEDGVGDRKSRIMGRDNNLYEDDAVDPDGENEEGNERGDEEYFDDDKRRRIV